MSLTNRTEMKRCGHRYATELDARCSKRGQQPGSVAEECWVPGCGGWHVRSSASASRHPLPQGADTGPDRATRLLVLERDGYMCTCGCRQSVMGRPHSIGHRKRRSQGGTNCPANLLTFLGWGNGLTVDDHHYRIDRRENPQDELRGLTVRRDDDPHLVAVRASLGYRDDEFYLTCDGQWSDTPAEVSA
jgi:hypothetical protein